MKKFFIVPLMALLLVSCGQVADYFKDAATYNNEIIDIYNLVVDEYEAYDTYYIETSWDYFDKIEERRQEAITTISQKVIELEMVGSFRDNNALIDVAIESSNRIIGVLETHDAELLSLWAQINNDEISEGDYNTKSQEVTDLASEELISLSDDFDVVQAAFAAKYNYDLEYDYE